MDVRDTLTSEQTAVIVTACEEGYLISVMDEWRARQRWAEAGNARMGSDLTENVKAGLIPHFSAVVAELADRGWLHIEEGGIALIGNDLRDALADPDSWVATLDSDHRMIMLVTTDAWDDTVRRGDIPGVA